MASERDPREDPRPGDKLNWRGFVIEVQSLSNGIMCYRTRDSMGWMGPAHSTPEQWRKWAANAELIRVADEGEKE